MDVRSYSTLVKREEISGMLAFDRQSRYRDKSNINAIIVISSLKFYF